MSTESPKPESTAPQPSPAAATSVKTPPATAAHALEVASPAVERMTERLKMDSIVLEYSKKLKALEDSEKRILRFIKLQGLDKKQDPELEKRLSEEGVDVSDWHRLLALGRNDEGHTAVTQLAELIGHLEKDRTDIQNEPGSVSAEKITNESKQINSEVRVVTERTLKKIDGLIDAVKADMAAVVDLKPEIQKALYL